MIVESGWDPSLDQPRDNFGKAKPKKRVTFSEATLAAYNKHRQNNRQQQNKGSHPTSSQLEQLEHNNKNNKESTRRAWKMSFQRRKAREQLPELAGMSPSKSTRRCSNSLQQLRPRRSLEHRHMQQQQLRWRRPIHRELRVTDSSNNKLASLQIPKAQQQHKQLRNRK